MRRLEMREKKKVSLDIEAYAWLTETGIQTSVYIGQDVDGPQFENEEAFETLIDSALEGCECNGKFARYHKEEIEELLTTLKNAYEYAERQVQETGFHD
jgi:hypothetical protein